MGIPSSRGGPVVWALLSFASACGPDLGEAGRAGLRDALPSDLPTSVAVMSVIDVPQNSGTPLRVSAALGSGVLLCPNAVLTVQHVASFGSISVTNREVALASLPGMATDRATGERRPVTLHLPAAEDARQVGGAVTRTLVLAQDARFGTVADGLALLRVEPAFPADLPYPAVSTVTDWAAGEVGQVHGYGPSLTDDSDTGHRRKADLSFLGAMVRGPQAMTRLLTFQDPHSVEGDSGGPIFGPVGRAGPRSLAGLDVGLFPGRPVSVAFDLAANAEWIRTERDRICPPRAACAAPDEEPAAMLARADDGGALPEAEIALSGDLAAELGPDDVVCVCEDDECTACGTEDGSAEDRAPEPEPASDEPAAPAPADDCADYEWRCFCVPCDGWDDGGDGCCELDDETDCDWSEPDPACAG